MSDCKMEECLPPLPIPERGYGFQIYATDKGKMANHFIYAHKSHVVMRSFENPTKCVIWSGHKDNVRVARFAPAGGYVASGDDTGKVLIWPSTPNGDGEYILKMPEGVKVNSKVTDLAWDPEGKRIVAVGEGNPDHGMVFSWDTANTIGNVNFHSQRMLSCDYKPSRPFRIVTTGEDNAVALFNGPPFSYDSKADPACRDVHTRYPNKVRYNPSGDNYISVGSDKKIVMFDGKSGEKVKEFESKENHKGAIYSFDWNDDGKKIVTVSADKTAKIWDVATGEVDVTFTMGTTMDDMQMGVVWLKNWIVTVSLDGRLSYLDAASGTVSKVLHGHSGTVAAACRHRESGVIFTGDQAGKVSVWRNNAATWLNGAGHGKGIRALGVSKDGKKIYSAGLDDCVIASDVESGEFGGDKIKLGGAPTSLMTGNKTDLVAITVAQGKIVMLQGGTVTSIDVKYTPTSCAFSPDDSMLAVSGDDKKVHMYAVSGTKLEDKGTRGEHIRTVRAVAWSPDGKMIVSAGDDCTVQVHEGDKKKNPSDWHFHTARVNSLAWSPNGKRVCSTGADQNLFVFDDCEKFTASKKKQINCHDREVIFCDWVDDHVILTVGLDGVMKTWRLE